MFFENSNEEGVPEFDVLFRIFNIEQRQGMNAMLLDATLQNLLQRARKFRKDTRQVRGTWKTGRLDLETFRDWRKQEVFEEGAALNAIHAPLRCGDVFRTATGEETTYVFLGQPCDLMIRPNGKRTAQVGLLAVLSQGALEADSEAFDHRYFEIKGVFGPAESWLVDFKSSVVVDASVVDLSVFNSDGRVRLQGDQAEPGTLLTLGWLKRLKRAKEQFFTAAGIKVLPLGIGARADALKGEAGDNVVSYPLQRTGRFEANTSTAILAAWATFQTRAALEHDFASEGRKRRRQEVRVATDATTPSTVADAQVPRIQEEK